MTRLDQLKLATRGLVLDEASHDSLNPTVPPLGQKLGLDQRMDGGDIGGTLGEHRHGVRAGQLLPGPHAPVGHHRPHEAPVPQANIRVTPAPIRPHIIS